RKLFPRYACTLKSPGRSNVAPVSRADRTRTTENIRTHLRRWGAQGSAPGVADDQPRRPAAAGRGQEVSILQPGEVPARDAGPDAGGPARGKPLALRTHGAGEGWLLDAAGAAAGEKWGGPLPGGWPRKAVRPDAGQPPGCPAHPARGGKGHC